jgi:hypothetical protein
LVWRIFQVPKGRKNCSVVPAGTYFLRIIKPSHKWLGYSHVESPTLPLLFADTSGATLAHEISGRSLKLAGFWPVWSVLWLFRQFQ